MLTLVHAHSDMARASVPESNRDCSALPVSSFLNSQTSHRDILGCAISVWTRAEMAARVRHLHGTPGAAMRALNCSLSTCRATVGPDTARLPLSQQGMLTIDIWCACSRTRFADAVT